ncbi:hypothetical protein MY04_4777 [Flammeovirga sp. MY04]|uniref:hypothetical protein n=1 Tax=Flammeovirga sp. MY04 TaxID=1191459 RepID=UPI000806114F|nr:hypothetical protein [Flammeovirga sp. MY04]ANQ49594.1 hypothetical protein MY04_2220 [Flammeovirga sp. MY04]ANQ52112.1 hypothetical protein MY04_4777 [Flammeovirga sp. MY04]
MAVRSIEKTAQEFQNLDREIKALQAKQKPLKAKLIDYAKSNTDKMDEAFQIKFKCGTYIAQRTKDCLDAKEEAKIKLIEQTDGKFLDVKLDEPKVVAESGKDNRIKKLLAKLGISIGQKVTLAVYAG